MRSAIQSDAQVVVAAAGGDDEKALVARQIIDGVKVAAVGEGGLGQIASSRESPEDIGWVDIQVTEDWTHVRDLRSDTSGGEKVIAGSYSGGGHHTTVDIRVELAEAIRELTATP